MKKFIEVFNLLMQGLNQSYVPGLIPQTNIPQLFPYSFKFCNLIQRELKINLLNHSLDGSKGHGLHLIYFSNGKTLKLMDLAIVNVLNKHNQNQKYWNVIFNQKHTLIALMVEINDLQVNVSFINAYHLSSNQFNRKQNHEVFVDKEGHSYEAIQDSLYQKING